jgi:hypothetical protein
MTALLLLKVFMNDLYNNIVTFFLR